MRAMGALPSEMTAIGIAAAGGPEQLRPVRRPLPRPGDGEVLVRIAAAGLNRMDVQQRQGSYPPPPGASDLPGVEFSGHVAALGAGVTEWREGDAVCALVAGGGYAEYAVVHESNCLPVPAGVDLVDAAGLPETYFTVWTNVFDRGRLAAGERFLVHGGASGIGTTAIQLAAAFGATVYATAGSAEKVAAAQRLGAALAVNYREADFVEAFREATGGAGVDLILCMVGGDYANRNLRLLAMEGRLVQLAVQAGNRAEIELFTVMRKRLSLTGSTLRARSVAEKQQIRDALRQQAWPLFADGRLRPVTDSRFPLAEAAEAHRRMEADRHIGKILLTI